MMYSGTESTTNKEGATIFEVRAWHCVSERRATMWGGRCHRTGCLG